MDGNEKAQNAIRMTWELMDILGFERERLGMEWLSASESTKFVQIIKGFTETIYKLGPSISKAA
ncbi:MAG: hydrogenase iron-sulfur subunit [Deltaproteobacteria bacterium]|nr:hydrogenase iron-sulfur subunit [Deltaproteobacteria bacterium]